MELAEIDLDPGLTLTTRGKTYVIEAPGARDGFRIWRFFHEPKATDIDHFREVVSLLGAQWDEEANTVSGGLWSQMEADGLSWPEVMRIGETALLNFGRGPVAAAAYWGRTPTFAVEESEKDIPETKAAPSKRAPAKKKG